MEESNRAFKLISSFGYYRMKFQWFFWWKNFVAFIFQWLHKSYHKICEFSRSRSCLKTKPPFLMTSWGKKPIKNGAGLA